MPVFTRRDVVAASIAVAGVALVASAQEWTTRPQPTQARVWVENRKPTDAVAVAIIPSLQPLPVAVAGTTTVITDPRSLVSAKLARQVWEYSTVRIAAGQDPVHAGLASAGLDGWEATGITYQSGSDQVLVLKRPR